MKLTLAYLIWVIVQLYLITIKEIVSKAFHHVLLLLVKILAIHYHKVIVTLNWKDYAIITTLILNVSPYLIVLLIKEVIGQSILILLSIVQLLLIKMDIIAQRMMYLVHNVGRDYAAINYTIWIQIVKNGDLLVNQMDPNVLILLKHVHNLLAIKIHVVNI